MEEQGVFSLFILDCDIVYWKCSVYRTQDQTLPDSGKRNFTFKMAVLDHEIRNDLRRNGGTGRKKSF